MADKDIILKNTIGDKLFPAAYRDHKGSVIHNGLVTGEDRDKWNGYEDQINSHVSNSGIHVTSSSKTKWNNHVNDATATLPIYHLTSDDRELLNSIYDKIYPIGCVYSSVSDTTPTFEGTVWDPIDTLEEEPTIYRWVRIG